jgi:hypothetical protein
MLRTCFRSMSTQTTTTTTAAATSLLSTGLVSTKDAHNHAAKPLVSPVHATARSYFVQSPPRIGNAYTEDGFLRDTLARLVPPDAERFEAGPRQVWCARRCAHWSAGPRVGPHVRPSSSQIDGWGVRTDASPRRLPGTELQAIAVEEGLMAIGYERAAFGSFARVYQFAKLYLFSGASAVADCPLAMTNGAAKLVDESPTPISRRAAFIVSRRAMSPPLSLPASG